MHVTCLCFHVQNAWLETIYVQNSCLETMYVQNACLARMHVQNPRKLINGFSMLVAKTKGKLRKH